MATSAQAESRGGRTRDASDDCLTVKAVLRMLGYADAIVEARDAYMKGDPLGLVAHAVDPSQQRDCP